VQLVVNTPLCTVQHVSSQVRGKDDEIAQVESRFSELNEQLAARDSVVERLKQDIQDEISKQKLVEKKGQTTVSYRKTDVSVWHAK